MELTLNIYKGREIEKVYKASEYDIMFGTVEDLINLIDTDKLTGNVSDTDFISAVVVLLKGGFEQVKSLFKELFPGVTDEELKRVKMKDIAKILISVLKYGFAEMAGASKGKN